MVRPWSTPGAAQDAQRGAVSPRIAFGNGVEHFSGNGDPNGMRRARIGSLYIQRDAVPVPVVWINIDGAFAWVALASVNDICDNCGCVMARNRDSDDFTWEPDTVLRYFVSTNGQLSSFPRSGGWWFFLSNITSPQFMADRDCPWAFGTSALTQLNLDFHWKGHLEDLTVAQDIVEIGLVECGADPVGPAARTTFRAVAQGGQFFWVAVVQDSLGNEDVYQDALIPVSQTCPDRQLLRIQGTPGGVQFTVDGVQLGFASWADPQTAGLFNRIFRRYQLTSQTALAVPTIFSDKWCVEQDEACIIAIA